MYKKKKEATVFLIRQEGKIKKNLGIDDIIGWYGNSALEAMSCGIPTIAHISEHALRGVKQAGISFDDFPLINVPMDAEGMYEELKKFVNMSEEEQTNLSLRTRKFIEDFHSYQANAKDLSLIYDKVLTHKSQAN